MVWRKFLCNFFVCHPLFLTCSSLLCSARSVNILSNFIALFTYNVLCGNKRRNRNSNKSEQRETEPCTRMVKTVSMWNNVNNISYTFYSQQKKKKRKNASIFCCRLGQKHNIYVPLSLSHRHTPGIFNCSGLFISEALRIFRQ